MWTLRRSHQHIKPEALSEYLDGRLQGRPLARVDQQLESCDVCRDELESLRAMVTLLRDLPVEPPRQNFTMAAPPPQPVQVIHSPLLKVPQWAYAGAASVAAIVLVVLVSADATGLLAPDEPAEVRTVEAPAVAQVESEATEGEVTEAERSESQAAEPTPVAAAAITEEMAVEPPSESLEMAAAAFPEEEPAAAPVADEAGREVESWRVARESEVPITPPEEETSLGATQEAKQATDSAVREVPDASQESTAIYWRVLEVLAGIIGLVFLAGLTLRWRISRRRNWT